MTGATGLVVPLLLIHGVSLDLEIILREMEVKYWSYELMSKICLLSTYNK